MVMLLSAVAADALWLTSVNVVATSDIEIAAMPARNRLLFIIVISLKSLCNSLKCTNVAKNVQNCRIYPIDSLFPWTIRKIN
ncbi:hypothetical protein CIP107532_00201 [Corynebacterium diphtheriae]|nr:hypothetical protein CIP107532_00201 [Corynebacterium diphtheriae]